MSYHTELLPDPLPAEPLVVVSRWLDESWKAAQQPNPNAMVLATVDPEGQPSARVVLCKEIVPAPGTSCSTRTTSRARVGSSRRTRVRPW